MSEKPLKLVFAPGCFDNFEGTQEELDALIADLQALVESGEFEKYAVPATDIPSSVLAKMEAFDDLEDLDEADLDALHEDYKKKLN